MRILILEDDENRIAKFKQNFIGCEMTITKNPQEANKWLEEKEFDLIFLDCDLAPEHYNSSVWTSNDCSEFDETSGVCVGKFLGNNLHLNPNAKIIVHSANPVGALRIAQYCEKRKPRRISYDNLWKQLIINL